VSDSVATVFEGPADGITHLPGWGFHPSVPTRPVQRVHRRPKRLPRLGPRCLLVGRALHPSHCVSPPGNPDGSPTAGGWHSGRMCSGKRPVRKDALGRLAGRPRAAVMMDSCLSGFGMCSMPTSTPPRRNRMTREACWGCIPGEPRVDQGTLDFDTTCVPKRRWRSAGCKWACS